MVIGTDNAGAGTRVGVYFDTNERNGGGVVVEKVNDGGNEDHRMHFYVTKDGEAISRKAVTIAPNGAVGIGTDNPQATLDVPGTTRTTVLQITSDRRAKQNFESVNGRDVLAKLAALPITTWAYTSNPSIRHLGPVAQDFAAAFALGADDQHIATVDADGVALAAIQGLHQLVQEKERRVAELEARLSSLEKPILRRFNAPPAAQQIATPQISDYATGEFDPNPLLQ